MKFSILATLVALAAPLLAAATPAPRAVCAANQEEAACTEIVLATSPIAIDVLGLLDIFIPDLDVQIALGCGPLLVVSRDEGTTQNVCCDSFEPLEGQGNVGINCEAAS